MAQPDVVLRGAFGPADERRYTHVPFSVPADVRSLHVEYVYSNRIHSDPRLRDGNTLDIGLFDPRGFRGWSGSHKDSFTLTATWATPSYLPGPILPGTWYVLLGPYKVAPHGCEYVVSIVFGSEAALPPAMGPEEITASPPSTSAAAEDGWLRGDLHCHSVYSDGDSWPADVLADAVRRGLDFLGVTDHNQVSHHAAYARVRGPHLPIVVPGVEVTTYGGHWNAWGTDTWWEFREPSEAATTRAMQAAAASGALVSVNHPKPFGPPWDYPGAVGFHAIEIWNGGWHEHNDVSLAWWDSLLLQGRRLTAVGGSDTHHLKDPTGDHLGRPTTWVCTDSTRSVDRILAALRDGRAFISRDVDGPQLYLTSDHVRVVDGGGATLTILTSRGVDKRVRVPTDDWTTSVTVQAPYVRAQVASDDGEMLVLSNPVWAA